MASENNKVLRVNEAADRRVREAAETLKIPVSEAANKLLLREDPGATVVPAPLPLPALPPELESKLETFASSKGLAPDDALAHVLEVGFKRIAALAQWSEKDKAQRESRRTKEEAKRAEKAANKAAIEGKEP